MTLAHAPARAPADSSLHGPSCPPSLEDKSVTHEVSSPRACPNGTWMRGECEAHANIRWRYRPCKRRHCEVCGPNRARANALRIAYGIEHLTGIEGAGWFVGTWAADVEKKTAVKTVARFIAWLRRHSPAHIEYACTWEQTRKHRLHVNLILAPWKYIDQEVLSQAWQRLSGAKVIWIKRVGAGIGQEAAKSRSKYAHYVVKAYQRVPTGKATTFSKLWPSPPETPPPRPRAPVFWTPEQHCQDGPDSVYMFATEKLLGHWFETKNGDYAPTNGPICKCFEPDPPDQRQRLGETVAARPPPTIPSQGHHPTDLPTTPHEWGGAVG